MQNAISRNTEFNSDQLTCRPVGRLGDWIAETATAAILQVGANEMSKSFCCEFYRRSARGGSPVSAKAVVAAAATGLGIVRSGVALHGQSQLASNSTRLLVVSTSYVRSTTTDM